MSWQSGRRVLVLGGIRSGKSELGEDLVTGYRAVRYVATGGAGTGDEEWTARVAAHRDRRPSWWDTEEIGTEPNRLATLLAEAKPDEALLVDDLGTWLTAMLDAGGGWDENAPAGDPDPAALAAAVRDCPAGLLVLVSPEVGLSVVPASAAGRTFADLIGTLNRALADACDTAVLVVAGQPTWLKGTDPRATTPASTTPVSTSAPADTSAPAGTPRPASVSTAGDTSTPAGTPAPASVSAAAGTSGTATAATAAPPSRAEPAVAAPTAPAWAEAVTIALPVVAPRETAGDETPIAVNMPLPMPDEEASGEAGTRLSSMDFIGAGLGALSPVVRFAAGTQGQPVPRPWQSVRMFLLHADHEGGVAAGDTPDESARRLAAAERGEGSWAVLAGAAGVDVRTVRCPGRVGPIEDADALDAVDVEVALSYGYELAQHAIDEGTDLIALGSLGAGADAAAVAVIVTMASGEMAALLGRVIRAGRIDDAAWMRRCAAIRDALHRIRSRARDPKSVLAMLGGSDHAVATGIVLGAVARRTPVLLDGPVGVAAALVARDFGAQTRHWLVLPDDGGHPAVRLGAEVLGVTPVLDLKLGLGEGATALAALPLLRSALTLAATLPVAAGEPAADGPDSVAAGTRAADPAGTGTTDTGETAGGPSGTSGDDAWTTDPDARA